MEQFRANQPQPENDPWQIHGQFTHEKESESAAEKRKKNDKKNAEEQTQKKNEAEKQRKQKQPEKEKTEKKQESKDKELEKTKEEKREELVERSRELKHKYEDEPIPRDPALVARLLVAEHILSLHEQIETPRSPKEALERDTLLASLAYMGDLAEKLEDPTKEVGPEIEAAYAMVLTLAETALTETDPRLLVTQNEAANKLYHEIITEPERTGAALEIELHNRATTPIPPLVQHLLTLRRNAITVPITTHTKPNTSDGDWTVETKDHHSPTTAKKPEVKQPQAPFRPEIPEPSVTPLVATAAIAASLHREKINQDSQPQATLEDSPSREDILRAALSSQHTSSEIPSTPEVLHKSKSIDQPAAATLFPATPDQPRLIFPENTHYFPRQEALPSESTYKRESSKPKLEHLPLTTLLTMAEGVSVGYGRYLRQEFESGHLDKEGLIKVLKSRAKGKDFFVEFQNQTTRFQTLKADSPEFLTSAPPPPPPPLPNEPLTTAFNAPLRPQQRATQKQTLPKPIVPSTEAKVAKENVSVDWQGKIDGISNKTWLAAIMLSSVILILLVLSLIR